MRRLFPLLILAAALPAVEASALTITVNRKACRYVATYTPAPDVEYRPGVDVHGKRVAPADLNGGFSFDPLEEVIIDVPTDVFGRLTGRDPGGPSGRRLRRDSPAGPLASGSAGYITFENGRLLFNGRPIVDPFEEELAELCAAARRGR